MRFEETYALYHRAGTLIDINRAEEAIPLLHKILAYEPDDEAALCRLAWAHYRLDQHAEGLKYADAAVRANPKNEMAYRYRSYCLTGLKRLAESLDAAHEALNLAPDSSLCVDAVAQALLHAGRLNDAEHMALRLVELAPDVAESHITLGVIYSRQKRSEEAEQCERRALAINPNCSLALNNLGVTLKNAGNLYDPLEMYYAALKAEPDNENAQRNLETEIRNHGFASVSEYLAARTDPEKMFRARRFREHIAHAEECANAGQWFGAENAAQRALKQVPTSLAALDIMARRECGRGNLPAALRVAQYMIELEPQTWLGYWRQSNILLAMRKTDVLRRNELGQRALASAQAAVQCAPDNVNTLLILAEVQSACELLPDAEQTLKTLISLRPHWNRASKFMGDIYRQQKHLRLAEMYYLKAVDLDKSDDDLINEIGLALWDMGCRDQAHSCFERACELQPDNVMYRFNRARYAPWQFARWLGSLGERSQP